MEQLDEGEGRNDMRAKVVADRVQFVKMRDYFDHRTQDATGWEGFNKAVLAELPDQVISHFLRKNIYP